jgi:hypothetical protein
MDRRLTHRSTGRPARPLRAGCTELREQDRIEPGQEFEVQRLARGEYRLERWFDAGMQPFRCLPRVGSADWHALDAASRAPSHGRASNPIQDSLIAATALVHELVVVTQNRADFEHAGVRIHDPFAS